MTALPPLPEGYELQSTGRPDPWEILQAAGFTATNGYRTDQDVERIRRDGFNPARNGAHNRGDGVDLLHATLPPRAQKRRLEALARQHGWEGAVVLDEGHHRHLAIPGWGAAPGTPGTPNSGLPPLPEGFELLQRGSLSADGNFVTDPLPAEGPAPTAQFRASRAPARGGPVPAPPLPPLSPEELAAVNAPRRPRPALTDFDQLDPTRGSFAHQAETPQAHPNPVSVMVPEGIGERVVEALTQQMGIGTTEVMPNDPNGSQIALTTGPEQANRLRRTISTLEAAFDAGQPDDEIIALAQRLGIPELVPDWQERLRPVLDWRRNATPEQLAAHGSFVPADRLQVRPQSPDAASSPGATPPPFMATGELRPSQPNWGDSTRQGIAGALEPLVGREAALRAGEGAEGLIGYGNRANLLSIIPPAEWAAESNERRQQALIEGRPFDAAREEAATVGNAAMAIPFFGRARNASQLAQRALRELEEVAGRAGLDAGQAADNELADLARRNWDGLSPETRALLSNLAPGGDALPPSAIHDLRRAATVPPSLLERTGIVRRRTPRAESPDAGQAADDLPPLPPGYSLVEPTSPASSGGRIAAEDVHPQTGVHRADVEGWGYADAPEGLIRAIMAIPDLPMTGPWHDKVTFLERRFNYQPKPQPLGGGMDVFDADGNPSAAFTAMMGGGVNDNRLRALGQDLDPDQLAALARNIQPQDLRALPSNQIEDAAEAARANPGTVQAVRAPDERTMLEMRSIAHPRRNGSIIKHRGPLDAEAFLRLRGGVRDEGGELRHIGITNKPRDDAPGDRRLGPIVNNKDGMTLDEAGELLHSRGYVSERPTTADVVDILREGRIGQRLWHSDDLGEVADFNNAQAMRHEVEAAEQSGAPLAERVGVPATLDDLRANEPPAMSYEEVLAHADRVAGVNLARMSNGKEIARSVRAIDSAFGIRGSVGRRSWAETEAAAREAGLTVEDILKANGGQPLSDVEAVAYRANFAKAHQEMMAIARRIEDGRGGERDGLLLEQAVQTVAMIQHKLARRRAETARAMSAMRMTADPRMIRGPALRAVIDRHGGPGRANDLARALVDMERNGADVGDVARFAVRSTKATWADKVVELNYASMLSAPSTHEINFLGNTAALLTSIPEFAVAAGLGGLRNLARRTPDRVAVEDVAAYIGGLRRGVREGLRLIPRVFRTGEDVDGIGRIESRTQNAIGGRAGYYIRTPLRALTAMDAFFKAMTRQGAIARLSSRAARTEGLEGEQRAERLIELIHNPSDEVMDKAAEFARYSAFQNTPGSFGQAVLNVTNKIPLLKLKVPFVRTIGNLVKYAVERTPIGPILPEVRRELIAGGERRDIAIAKMAVGSAIAWGAMDLAEAGFITGGGPLNYQDRIRLEETGWRPYSVWVGDRYVSYRRLDPLALIVATAADYATYDQYMTEAEREKGSLILMQMVSRNISDSFWLEAVSELMELAQDIPGKGPEFIGSTLGNLLVPNLIAQPTASYDSLQRDQRPDRDAAILERTWQSIKNRVMARVPGLRDNLPARTNTMGQPLRNDGRWGPDFASPFPQGIIRHDPVNDALLRNGLRVGEPNRETNGQRHTPSQQNQLKALSGRYIYEDMLEIVHSPDWRESTAEERRDWFDEIKRNARADARADLGLGQDEADSLPPLPSGFELEAR